MKATIAVLVAAAALAASCGMAAAKSLQACNEEFRANRAKIEGVQTEAAFVAACQKGQEVVTGATSVARPAVPPATAAKQPATPAKSAGEAEKTTTAP